MLEKPVFVPEKIQRKIPPHDGQRDDHGQVEDDLQRVASPAKLIEKDCQAEGDGEGKQKVGDGVHGLILECGLKEAVFESVDVARKPDERMGREDIAFDIGQADVAGGQKGEREEDHDEEQDGEEKYEKVSLFPTPPRAVQSSHLRQDRIAHLFPPGIQESLSRKLQLPRGQSYDTKRIDRCALTWPGCP